MERMYKANQSVKAVKNIVGYTNKGIPIKVSGVKRPPREGSVRWLKSRAKSLGYTGISKLNKSELERLIAKGKAPLRFESKTKAELKELVNLITPRQQLLSVIREKLGKFPTKRLLRFYPEGSSMKRAKLLDTIRDNLDSTSDTTLRLLGDVMGYNRMNKKSLLTVFQPQLREQAAKGWLKTYRIPGLPKHDPESYMELVKPHVLVIFKSEPALKVKIVLFCEMEKTDLKTGETILDSIPFSSDMEIVIESTDISELYRKMTERINENRAALNQRGSNWIFRSVLRMDVNADKYQPLRGSSWIDLPPKIKMTKSVINLKNKDNECFKWAVLASLFPVDKNAERISKYKEHVNKVSWQDVNFPADKKSIIAFEKANPDIAVNVLAYYMGVVYPWYQSQKRNHKGKTINLLLVTKLDDKGKVLSHYTCIKNLSRLLSSQINKHDGLKHFCLNCMNAFRTAESLKKHQKWCLENDGVALQFLNSDQKIKFNPDHYCRKMRVPFVIYADFECVTKPVHGCQPNPTESFTNKYQQHEPSGFGYYIVSVLGDCEYVQYTKQSDDENIGKIFVEKLENSVRELYEKYKFPKRMTLTREDRYFFKVAKACHICDGELGDDRVRDHCHLTGDFRGAAHNECNLKYKIPKFYPVFFHNLSGYDAHLFVKNLNSTRGKLNCIPNNEEKYISFSKELEVDTFVDKKTGKDVQVKRQIRFLDSFKFMSSSLADLVKNLQPKDFKHLRNNFTGEQLELLLRKGVFPYDAFNDISVLNETFLPPKEKFWSSLYEEGISDEDYEHATKVWKVFNMKTFREYHDLYMKVDVLQLADVFETFRDVCLREYQLDPTWYYTAPGLSWDAMLKTTKLEFDPITDPDMLLFFEKGIRGGVSMISNRHAKANNKYMKNFETNETQSFITYLDANNLYGWAMSQKLPIGNFKWMTEKQLYDWKEIPSFLEVDLEYPEKLHDLHKDYPFCPERKVVSKVEKLIPNLHDKKNYVIHYIALKQCLEHGLKLTKIHRGISFQESDKLKQYIDKNTQLRAKAANDFEKDFFKLMNNSIFGKTMENIRNRVDIKLIKSEADAKKLTAMPNYKGKTIFDADDPSSLVAVHMNVTKLLFDKPVYLGAAILDISKTLMYDFHYNYIKPKYDGKAKLLFTDTDSLMYHIETEDFYKDICNDIEKRFDTSNYAKDHPSGIPTGKNKKVIGMFKDEAGGKQITDFVGLRAKLYSYILDDLKEEKKCKGINKTTTRKNITFDDYFKCLISQEDQYRRMNCIRCHKHTLYTETINKVALSAADDKRIVLEDGRITVPYGYKGRVLTNINSNKLINLG